MRKEKLNTKQNNTKEKEENKTENKHAKFSVIVTKQAGAELCQAQFKLELGGFYLARYFALIGVGC